MNLNEALKILKENNYLAEFLNTSVSLDQLVKLMVKNNIISDDVIIEHDCDAISVQNPEEDLTHDDVYDFSEKCEKFIDRLAVFIRKYGWEFIHTSFSKADILNFDDEKKKKKKERNACQCRRHRFDPWSGKIPHTMEQLSRRTTTTEPAI